MNKPLIIAIFLGVVLIIGAALVGLSLKEKKGATPVQATVEITDSGFNPATISVKKGTVVTWNNKDSAPHWVASDPHPVHNQLPGFDSVRKIAAGESYPFTFEKTGTFTYHDHLNPLKFKGTVIVK